MNDSTASCTRALRYVPLVLAIVSVAAIPAGPPPSTTPEGIEGQLAPVVQVTAWGALLIGDTLVVLEEDFAHLAGYDGWTGKRRWRTKFQDEPNGQHTLTPAGDRVLVWAGPHLHVLDPDTGVVQPPAEVPYNNRDCRIDTHGSSCAVHCSCSWQLVDCGTGALLGPSHDQTYIEFIESDEFGDFGGSSGGCYGPGGLVLGRADDLLVALAEEPSGELGAFHREAVVGLSAADGTERWRSREAALGSPSAARSGISPDGATCWLGDLYGALRTVDCRTGALLWSRDPCAAGEAGLPETVVTWTGDPGGLLRQCGTTAALHDPTSGQERWTLTVAPGTLVIPQGMEIQPYSLGHGPLSVTVVSPTDGATSGRINVAQESYLWSDGAGGFLTLGEQAALYDATGNPRGVLSVPGSTGNMDHTAGVLILNRHDGAQVVDLRDIAPRTLGLVRGAVAAGQMAASPAGLVLLYRWNAGVGPGEAIVVTTPPSP